MSYIFLDDDDLDGLYICREYRDWLEKWLTKINENIEKESISSSECAQGILCEKLLGKNSVDWKQVEEEFLTDEDGNPQAYSEAYGKQLYNFGGQWQQMPVYAVYNSFWIHKHYGETDATKYQSIIRELIQPNGWIYNPEVSNTQIKTRMKSELLMSLAMGTEILLPDKLSKHDKDRFEAVLATMPLTGYVSAEYFRIKALKNIGRMYQFPEGLKDLLEKCEVQEGYNDFCLEEKRDDYMGTKKRTQHDSAIHTPLISHMVKLLCQTGGDELMDTYREKMHKYSNTLKSHPMGIPSFKMRDIEYSFGTGITPLEILAAVLITNKY